MFRPCLLEVNCADEDLYVSLKTKRHCLICTRKGKLARNMNSPIHEKPKTELYFGAFRLRDIYLLLFLY